MLAVFMACGAAFSPTVHRLRRRVAGSGVRGFGVLGIGVWGFRVRGSLWLLFVLPALAAGFGALDDAGRTAIVPNLVRRSELAGVNAIFQALFQFGLVAGPAVAGLLLAGAGVRFVYWMDVASFGAALATVFLISPQPVGGATEHRPYLRSIIEGLRFVRGRKAIQDAYLIDTNAMVFGMPPALAPTLFGGRHVDARVPIRGPRRGSPGRGAHHRLGQPDPASGARGHRRGHHVGHRNHLFRAGVLAARRAGTARRGRLGRRDLGGVPQHDRATGRARRAAGRLSGLQIAVVTGGPRVGDLYGSKPDGASGNVLGAPVARRLGYPSYLDDWVRALQVERRIAAALQLLGAHRVEEVATSLAISSRHLHRVLFEQAGLGPKVFQCMFAFPAVRPCR